MVNIRPGGVFSKMAVDLSNFLLLIFKMAVDLSNFLPLTNVNQVTPASNRLIGRNERRGPCRHVVAAIPVRPGHSVPLRIKISRIV